MIDKITGKTNILEKALDASWLRNEAISNNIANANTPGYKRSYVKFEDVLSDSIGKFHISGEDKDPEFLPIGNDVAKINEPQIVTEDFTSMRKDENNVDVDVEMADLAKNTIEYNTLITQLSKEFNKIKSAINEGRR